MVTQAQNGENMIWVLLTVIGCAIVVYALWDAGSDA